MDRKQCFKDSSPNFCARSVDITLDGSWRERNQYQRREETLILAFEIENLLFVVDLNYRPIF